MCYIAAARVNYIYICSSTDARLSRETNNECNCVIDPSRKSASEDRYRSRAEKKKGANRRTKTVMRFVVVCKFPCYCSRGGPMVTKKKQQWKVLPVPRARARIYSFVFFFLFIHFLQGHCVHAVYRDANSLRETRSLSEKLIAARRAVAIGNADIIGMLTNQSVTSHHATKRAASRRVAH